ncbi:MAG: homocysteine S-methyltransferase family protein [Myxococcota bacterium]
MAALGAVAGHGYACVMDFFARRQTVLLDGALGTALMDRGLPQGVPPELWVLQRPDVVTEVHAEHVAAGAQAVLTCTLNAHPGSLRPQGLHTFCGEIRRQAVACARRAGPSVVLGVVGPLTPGTPARVVEALAEAAAYDLAHAGVDALVLETVTNLEEGAARVRGALSTGLPVVVTVVPGTPAARDGAVAAEALLAAGARVVGVNCAVPAECAPVLAAMRRAGATRLWAKPSAGLPGALLDPRAFAEQTAALLEHGVGWVGGCCGASTAHLAALSQTLLSQGGLSSGEADSPAGAGQEWQRG